MAAPPASPQPVLVPLPANAPPLPAPVSPLPIDPPEEKPTRAARPRHGAAAGPGIPKGVAYGIAAYALVMTLLAIYGLFIKSGEKLEPGHPLSTIPDNFGEFDPASRKKVTMYKFPVDGELPANQRAGLGGKIEVGQLVIEPVQIERRSIDLVADGKGEKGRRQPSPGTALALRLRVKNVSEDLSIFPLDPAFTRRAVGDDKPATRIVIGSQTFAGGSITWPFPAGTRHYDLEQAADATPLKPGETRQYVVLSSTQGALFQALEKSKDSVLWRVEVRRGLVEFRGKDRPVNAIIGVEFKRSDVR